MHRLDEIVQMVKLATIEGKLTDFCQINILSVINIIPTFEPCNPRYMGVLKPKNCGTT